MVIYTYYIYIIFYFIYLNALYKIIYLPNELKSAVIGTKLLDFDGKAP